MRKKLKYNACDPAVGIAPRLNVRPPVFATAMDAWNHFVRHPDEFPLVDDDDEDNRSLEQEFTAQTYDDTFDALDFLMNREAVNRPSRSSEEPGSEEAATVPPTEGNDARASEEPATNE